jgi:hypothetical protein
MKKNSLASIVFFVLLAVSFVAAQTTASTINHWVVVPSPNVSGQDNVLAAAAANSTSDVWFVGQFIPDSNQDLTQTLIEHWNGTSVSAVSSPNTGTLANALFAVTAKSGLAWAAGYFMDDKALQARSLIEALDGQKWNFGHCSIRCLGCRIPNRFFRQVFHADRTLRRVCMVSSIQPQSRRHRQSASRGCGHLFQKCLGCGYTSRQSGSGPCPHRALG